MSSFTRVNAPFVPRAQAELEGEDLGSLQRRLLRRNAIRRVLPTFADLRRRRGAGGAYTAENGALFDGTNDFMNRVDFVGNADSKILTFSLFVKPDVGKYIYSNSNSRVAIRLTTTTVVVSAKSPANVTVLAVASSGGVSLGSWVHILGSFDLSDTGKRHLYVDDVSDLVVTTYTDSLIDHTRSTQVVGAQHASGNKLDGCLQEFWLSTSEYIDFSVEANRRKFISAAVKPVSLGADGSTPTGTAPIMYLNNPFGSFETNKGTGGNLTVTGALAECGSSPSD